MVQALTAEVISTLNVCSKNFMLLKTVEKVTDSLQMAKPQCWQDINQFQV